MILFITDISQYRSAVDYLTARQSTEEHWGEQVFAISLSVTTLNLLSSINVPLDLEKAVHARQLVDASSGTKLSGTVIDVMSTKDDAVSIKFDGSFTVANLMGSLPDL